MSGPFRRYAPYKGLHPLRRSAAILAYLGNKHGSYEPYLFPKSFYPDLKLQQEKASVEKKVEQLQHNQQRLENRKSYYEKADRKKRTHRLCTIAGTMESIAPEIRELTLPEVNDLLESILDFPDVRRAIYNAVLLHREKEEPPIGPVSSECHTN